MFTGDNVAMQVCQYQKDRDEQARSEFPCVVSIDFLRISTTEGSKAQVVKFLSVHQYLCDTSCGRRRLSTTIQLFTILHTFSGRRSLLTAIQIFAIGNTSCGRRRLVIAIQLFTILHTLSGRRRSLLTAAQFFAIEYTSRGSRKLVIAI